MIPIFVLEKDYNIEITINVKPNQKKEGKTFRDNVKQKKIIMNVHLKVSNAKRFFEGAEVSEKVLTLHPLSPPDKDNSKIENKGTNKPNGDTMRVHASIMWMSKSFMQDKKKTTQKWL